MRKRPKRIKGGKRVKGIKERRLFRKPDVPTVDTVPPKLVENY